MRNMESKILFMQQEHAATLKALHEEIQRLQKKCTDLTFELNMAGLDLGKTVDPETKEHIKHLEHMIDTQRETQHELEVELEKKDKLIKEIEYTFKRQKMKQLEEEQANRKEIETLKAELESAANNNAYLQNELLKLKKEKFQMNQAAAGASALAPAPPKESRSNPKRAFHIRRTLDSGKEDAGVRELGQMHMQAVGVNARVGSGSTSRSDSPAELIKPFLRSDEEPEIINIKHSEPLPPIRTSSGRVVFKDQVDVVHVSVHNVPKPLSKSKKSVHATQEVETLAVGQLSHPVASWKHQRRKESHSSEYR